MALVIGIAGTLVGVIIGAFLTRWIDFHYEHRREIQQGIASALVLRAELQDARAGIAVIIEERENTGVFLFPGLEAWNEHRESLLAAGMSHMNWLQLAVLFRHLQEWTPSLKTAQSGMSDVAIRSHEKLKKRCEDGIEMLNPFVVEGSVPLLSPQSIFKGSD